MAAAWEVSAPWGWLMVCCFSLAWSSGLLALSEEFSPCGSAEPSAEVWPGQGRGNGRLVLLTCGLCFTVGLRWYLAPGELLQYLLSLGFCSPFECWTKSFSGVPPASFKASSWHLSSLWFFYVCVCLLHFCFSVLSLWLSCTSSWVCGFFPDCFFLLWRCKDQLMIVHVSLLQFQCEGTKLGVDFAFILFH